MIQSTSEMRPMIVDANVLIDFISVDRDILALIVQRVGPLYVASPIVDQVNAIEDESELVELGMIVIEPELEDAFAAANIRSPLEFEDWLCLLTAERNGFTCVTNDRPLQKECKARDIPVLWGLQLLLKLHKLGGISTDDVIDLAEKIRESNPTHITEAIIKRFKDKIQNKQEKVNGH